MPFKTKFVSANTGERLFTILKIVREFDKEQVATALKGMVGESTDREACYTTCYTRTVANVETLLKLKEIRDVQAHMMRARSMLEVAIDAHLLNGDKDAPQKMFVASELERLRSADRILEFESQYPGSVNAGELQVYKDFIANDRAAIEAKSRTFWPKDDPKSISHWSHMKLEKRAKSLGPPYHQLHATKYAMMSWYSHPGIIGFANLNPKTFQLVSGMGMFLAAEAYLLTLADFIRAMHLDKGNEKIMEMMRLAKLLPFTDSKEEAISLQQSILG
jgi:hypothetical protein